MRILFVIRQAIFKMSRLLLPLALCLLSLLVASLAEETAKTEQVNDDAGLERQVREAGDTNKVVVSRQKRHSK